MISIVDGKTETGKVSAISPSINILFPSFHVNYKNKTINNCAIFIICLDDTKTVLT